MHQMNPKQNKGFTLIELLVVVAIIGLLSSVVLTSLNNARYKARDAAIKKQMLQFRNLLELEFNNTGTYAALQAGWSGVSPTASCNTIYNPGSANPNVVQANKICNSLVGLSDQDPIGGTNGARFYTGIQVGAYTSSYSMMVYLPWLKKWQCIGVSGQSTVTGWQWYWNSPGAPTSVRGCYGAP